MRNILFIVFCFFLFQSYSQVTYEFTKTRPSESELFKYNKLLGVKINDDRIINYKLKEYFEAAIAKNNSFVILSQNANINELDSLLIFEFQITQDQFSQVLKERTTILKQPSGDNSVFYNEALGNLSIKLILKDSKTNDIILEKSFTTSLTEKSVEKDNARDVPKVDLTLLARQCSSRISFSMLKSVSNWSQKVKIEFEEDNKFVRLSEVTNYLNANNWNAALEILKQYSADENLKPKQKAKSLYNYGIVLLHNKDYDKAKDAINQAIALSPKDEKYSNALQLVDIEKNQDELLIERDAKKAIEREKYLAEESKKIPQNDPINQSNNNSPITEGKKIEYYEKGKIQSIGDRKNGEFIKYYYNGQIEEKGNYINYKRDGEFLQYHDNGQLKSRSVFVNDVPNGEVLTYHSNGQLDLKYNVVNGKYEGEYIGYYKDGQIERTNHYKSGKLHGQSVIYFNNGVVNLKRNYIDGIENGESISYFEENGKVRLVSNVRNGHSVGECREYYSNGQLYFKGTNDVNGYRQGVSLEYYENGQLKCKKNWLNTRYHGEIICYNEKGELISKEKYVNGIKQK